MSSKRKMEKPRKIVYQLQEEDEDSKVEPQVMLVILFISTIYIFHVLLRFMYDLDINNC